MCHFISWIEFDGHEYFLKNSDLETKEGKKLLRPDVIDDLCGHGAIRAYYPELKGKGEDKECTDFSTQKNFPKSIAKAIKNGELSRIGICTEILTAAALAEYNKVEAPAFTNIVKQKKNRNKEWK